MERLELARLLGAPPRLAEARMTPTVIEETDPRRFMASFATAASESGPVFLADPGWGPTERAQFLALVDANTVGHLVEVEPGHRPGLQQPAANPGSLRGWLCIPSGGTSGNLRLARHDEDTIASAVRGFCTHFGVSQVNAVGVLPMHHVSGLMAWMRCALTSGEYRPCDWKRLEAGDYHALTAGDWFLSLVPTQLRRLMESPQTIAWLRGFRAIFIGGGPVWTELMESAAKADLPVSLSYGMTETAAMVTALRPEEFRQGARSAGSALPHVQIMVGRDGLVRVAGESVFRGYWPGWREDSEFVTEDLGRLDERGQLHLSGRRDAIIITGGKKVQPTDVERALRATGEFSDVAVVGVPDAKWGERVVACYPKAKKAPDLTKVESALQAYLAPHQRPKRFVAIDPWPRNAQGKLNRALLAQLSVKSQ